MTHLLLFFLSPMFLKVSPSSCELLFYYHSKNGIKLAVEAMKRWKRNEDFQNLWCAK
jgi:hypothetical protein